MSRAESLASVLEGADSLGIVCHNNPDPDSLASALALEAIAVDLGVDDCVTVYGGEISHQQNRSFVTLFDLDLRPAAKQPLDDFDLVGFVDHSRPGVATTVPDDIRPDVVVDHHPGSELDADFVDIRVEYGATATVFVEYLEALDVPLTERLASALLFALHRERLDFVRDPTEREYRAALAVYPEAGLEVLEQLYGSAFTPATIDAIGRAISNRERRSSAVVAGVGRTVETDAMPQAADYLLNLEGVDTVLAYGVVGDAIRLSARSIDPRVRIGETLEDAFGSFGTVGGHHDMAGGRIDLGLFADEGGDDDAMLSFVDHRIGSRFFDTLNLGR